MASVDQKRRKKPNMTCQEKELLLDLVAENINVIENKKTDGVTTQMKNEQWQTISISFNSQGNGPVRDATNLRNVWENLKKASRKASAEIKMEALKTGGGTSKVITIDPILERVIELIRPSVEGLKNPYDGDSEPLDIVVVDNGDTIVLTEESAELSSNFEIHPTQFNWGQYTPNMLKSPKHPALQSTVTASCSGAADSANVQAIENCSTEAASEDVCDDSANVSVTAPSTSSKNVPPSWTTRRRPMLSKSEEPLAKIHKLKAEAIMKSIEQATEEHLWNKELHSLRLQQEQLKLEIEKVKLERENELLKHEKMKTEILLNNN